MAKPKTGSSAKTNANRSVALLERLIAKKAFVRTTAVSAADVAAAEKDLGQTLPADYVALVRAVGAIQDVDDDDDYDFGGWAGSLHRIMAPKDAVLFTKKVRTEAGKGRHEKVAADTFFFMRWERTLEAIGVDSKGAVRVHRSHRPGTLMRVAYASLEQCLVDKIGEMDPAQSVAKDEPTEEVTHLELANVRELPAVKKMAALEKLSVWGLTDGAPLAVVKALPKLRELHVGGELTELPDEVFRAPSLEHVELGSELQKRYSGGLNGVLKWFHTASIPIAKRPLYVRILIGDEVWLAKHADRNDLLAALDAPNERIAQNALHLLEPYLNEGKKKKAPPKLAGRRVAILGRTVTKASTLATQLAGAEATLDKKLSKDTDYAVIAVGPKGAYREADRLGVPLVLESQIRQALDAKGARYLAGERGEGASNLRQMLLSRDAANVRLAVRMMEEGGVPDGVLDAILLVTQDPKADAKARKALEKLANEKLPTFSKIIRDVLARTNLFASGATKLADRLAALHAKSKGIIDARAIALHLLEDPDRDEDIAAPSLLYVLETGDPEFIEGALARSRRGDGLAISGLEARAEKAIEKAAPAIARMKDIRRLSLAFNDMTNLPRAIAPLTSLRSLDLSMNALKTLPDWLASFTELENLDLSENRFAQLPPVVLQLSKLRELKLEQVDAKVRLRELPEGISALRHLETLSLSCARLPGLPDALGKLPKLKALDLSGAHIAKWPASLADAPQLESLDVSHVSTDDKVGLKDLVAKLKARGVKVT